MDLFGTKSRAKRRAAQQATYGDRVPPGQHLVQNWPVLTYGPTPDIPPDAWQLNVLGLVASEETFDFEQLKALGYETFHADFHCVTRFSMMDNDWSGVPVKRFMEKIQVLPEARAVMLHCYGGLYRQPVAGRFRSAREHIRARAQPVSRWGANTVPRCA